MTADDDRCRHVRLLAQDMFVHLDDVTNHQVHECPDAAIAMGIALATLLATEPQVARALAVAMEKLMESNGKPVTINAELLDAMQTQGDTAL